VTRPCRACERTGCKFRHEGCAARSHTCPACLGSGQVTDRIPAADAIADAETLRLLALAYFAIPLGDELDRAATHLSVQECGERFASEISYLAARAAFRAVPGLRG